MATEEPGGADPVDVLREQASGLLGLQIQWLFQLSARTQSSLQGRNMSGHSKWATTKYRKGAQDKARAKIFAKLIRQVEVAAREGGGDMDANAALRTAYQKARSSSVPLDTIEKAIKRGTGELEGVRYEAINYEGYGPAGVAIMVETLSDNRNRTGSEIRNLFNKNGGNMAEPGAVELAVRTQGHRAACPVTRMRTRSWRSPWRVERRTSRTTVSSGSSRALPPTSMPCVGPGRCRDSTGVRRPLAWNRPRWCPCPTRVRPSGSCGSSRRSTTTTTSRPSTPMPTFPTPCWRPSRAEARWSTPWNGVGLRYERMFVLGIDPGLSRCGYGLVARGEADSTLKARAAAGSSRPILRPTCRTGCYPPQRVAGPGERVLARRGGGGAGLLPGQCQDGHVRRASEWVGPLVAAEAACEVVQYTSNEVKQALVGYGAATKDQVQRMVANVLGLADTTQPARCR